MIVVDSSAVIAILENEDDAIVFARAIQQADNLTMSAVNAHECAVVLRGRRRVKTALVSRHSMRSRPVEHLRRSEDTERVLIRGPGSI